MNHNILKVVSAATILIASQALAAASSDLSKLQTDLDEVCQAFHGKVGYCIVDLKSGKSVGRLQSEMFPSASTIKACVLYETLKQIELGKTTWETKLILPPPTQRSKSMWAAYLAPGINPNLDGLCNLMMNYSDNAATVAISDHVGLENIEKSMNALGMTNTACTIHVPASNPRLTKLRADFQNMGVTSPADMAKFLGLLYHNKLLTPASNERMIRMMSHEYWDDFVTGQIPPGVYVCSKVGALERSRSNIAIVYGDHPYILTIYTDNDADKTWTINTEAHVLIRTFSKKVWQWFNPKSRYSPPEGYEKLLPTGGGVEDP